MTKPILTILFLSLILIQANAQTEPTPKPTPDKIDAAQTASQSSGNYVRPNREKRFKRYLNDTIGINGLISVGIGAGIGQATDTPPDWENNGKGLARRLGSSFGENAIQETVTYGLEEALRLDSKFYKSRKKDFGSRFKNALLSGFTARTPSSRRVFNPSRIIGTYAAFGVSTETWYPKRYNYQDGLRQGTQSLGFTVGFNFLREFIFPR